MDAATRHLTNKLVECEQAVKQLQVTEEEKFSVVGSDLTEVQGQIKDEQVCVLDGSCFK